MVARSDPVSVATLWIAQPCRSEIALPAVHPQLKCGAVMPTQRPSVVQLSEETLSAFTLCDASLIGITWEESGRDLCLHLITGDGRSARLTCAWAQRVEIDLRSEEGVGGYPLSWECTAARSGADWRLMFEFPPRGSVSLSCSEARIDYQDGGQVPSTTAELVRLNLLVESDEIVVQSIIAFSPLENGLYRVAEIPSVILEGVIGFHDVVRLSEQSDGAVQLEEIEEPANWIRRDYIISKELAASTELEAALRRVLGAGGQWVRDFGGILSILMPPDGDLDAIVNVEAVCGEPEDWSAA